MSIAKLLGAVLVACICTAVPSEAKASPIPYLIELTTTGFSFPFGCPSAQGGRYNFDCDVAVGDTFVGSFYLVDTSVLTGGASPMSATVAHFVLTVGGITWAQDFNTFQYPISAFSGFRTGAPLFEFSSTQLGFLVDGGQITRFADGADVYGHSDVPFVDFNLFPSPFPSFSAVDDGGSRIFDTYVLRAVRAVPEPAPLALILLSFAGMGLLRLRRRG